MSMFSIRYIRSFIIVIWILRNPLMRHFLMFLWIAVWVSLILFPWALFEYYACDIFNCYQMTNGR